MRSSRGPILGGAALILALGVAARPASPPTPAEWARYSVLTPAGPAEPPPEIFRKLKRLVYSEHTVQKGEFSAWHLAKLYGTNAMSLQATRGDEMVILFPGMRVMVHNQDGMLYRVRKDSESLSEIAKKFHKDPAAVKKFKEEVVRVNRLPGAALLSEYELEKDELILLPKIRMSFDTYRFPFREAGWHRISSRFGNRFHPILGRRKFHEGLDLPKPWGTPVYPARSGIVAEAGWREGYGLLVVIRHTDGATTRYGHLSKVHVKPGMVVQRGKSLIGRVGSTGLSTGPHLHFEVRDKHGRAINPQSKIGRR